MNIGMLWFDNDPKAELSTKIERAAVYYRNKYGKNPTLCYVHPSMLPETSIPSTEGPQEEKQHMESIKSAGVEVRPTRSVLPNHFWIGINGTNGSNGKGSVSPSDV